MWLQHCEFSWLTKTCLLPKQWWQLTLHALQGTCCNTVVIQFHQFQTGESAQIKRRTQGLWVKYDTTMAITWKFPNRTIFLELLLAKEIILFDQKLYCDLTAAKQLVAKDKANNLSKFTILLVNLKNEVAKKDLRLAYTLGIVRKLQDSFRHNMSLKTIILTIAIKRGTRTRRMITPSQKKRAITMLVL